MPLISRNSTTLATALAALGFVLIYLTLGFHYETNDDGVMELIFRGILLPAATTREIGMAHQFVASGLGWLYRRVPQFPWYGVWMYVLTLAAATGLLASVDQALPPGRPWRRVAVLGFFLLAFLSESVLLLNFTRVAILLAGASVLSLQYIVRRGEPPHWLVFGVPFALFGFAAATRLEGAELSLVTAGAFVLLTARRHELRRLAVSIALLASIVGLLQAGARNNPREAHFRSVIPFLVNVRDFGWTKPRSLTAEQALRREAINQWLFSDRETVSTAFLGRLSSDSYVTSDKLQLRRLAKAGGDLLAGLGEPGWLLALANAVVFATALRRREEVGTSRLLRCAAAHALFWALLVLLAIFGHVVQRVLSPILAVYACASVITAFDFGVPRLLTRRVWALSAAAVALLAALPALGEFQRASTYNQRQRVNETRLRMLRSEVRGSVLVMPSPALSIFVSLDPLRTVGLDPGNRYVMLNGWPCLLDGQEEDVRALAGSSSFPELLCSLAGLGAEVLSNDGYNQFLTRYASTLYGLRLSFSPRSQLMPLSPDSGRQLRIYAFAAASSSARCRSPRSGS